MKISREKREQISESFGAWNILDLEKIIDRVLSGAGVEVESKPELLPNVSEGTWNFEYDGNYFHIFTNIVHSDDIARQIKNSFDARLMARSKDMAEWMGEVIVKMENAGLFPVERRKGKTILVNAGANLDALEV